MKALKTAFLALLLISAVSVVFYTVQAEDTATPPAAQETPMPAVTADEAIPQAEAPPPAETVVNINAEAALSERVIGNVNAPVTLVEYASMTCPHCAEFHNTRLPQLKKDYLDTGKVKLIYRDMPTDAIALKAAMMARCAPADQYFNIIETIFATQDRWMQGSDLIANLTQIGKLAGMDEKTITACMENEELRKGLLRRVEHAQHKWYFSSTPSFVLQQGVYEETFKGVLPYEEIQAKLNKLVK